MYVVADFFGKDLHSVGRKGFVAVAVVDSAAIFRVLLFLFHDLYLCHDLCRDRVLENFLVDESFPRCSAYFGLRG